MKFSQEVRRQFLIDLIKEIESGEYIYDDVDLNKLYELHNSVRHEYLSPKEVSGKIYSGQTSSFDIGPMI